MAARTRLHGLLWFPMTITLALASAGCGDEERSLSFHYPLDDSLRLNHIQSEATHNSYHVQTPGNNVSVWAYTHQKLEDQLEKQGVRGFELDIHFNVEQNAFEVYHLDELDGGTTCRQ